MLLGHKFITHSDTEVIIHAYESWGEACVEKFRGMFAFAIWDEKQQKLFSARDRLGIKPLYYYFDSHLFAFSSEIKANPAVLIVKSDAVSIIDKLSWYFDEPFAYSSAIPTYYVSSLARERVKVALSGDGGYIIFDSF